MRKRLIFIRHGQTDENLGDTLHIHTENEKGLNKTGIQQIQKVAEVCRENNVDVVFCSSENRALESAEIITKALGLQPPIVLPELLERNWGDWEGKPWDEVQKDLDTLTLEDRYTFLPPHGESWQQMEKRLKVGLQKLMDSEGKNIVVVTHGGALRGLMPVLKNAPKQTSFIYQFHNASATIFDYVDGQYKEVAVNDTSHLGEALQDCIFCKIVQGKLPSFKIWEDDKFLAFLSVTPNTEGFSVVIPKKHYSGYVFGMPDEEMLAFMHGVKTVSQLLENKLDDVGRTAVILEGFGIDHAHAKLFPMHKTIGMRVWNKPKPDMTKFFTEYEGYVSSHSAERMSDERLQELAEKIRS